MPGMSGTDLAEALRERRPGLPVLVVSGYAESVGIAVHLPRLSKPFRKDQLAACISELIPEGTLDSRRPQRN
jgi:FixJ family two-component response regulator